MSQRRVWHPTPGFLPGKSHAQRSLEGYSLWGCKELDMTEWLSLSLSMYNISLALYVNLYLEFTPIMAVSGYGIFFFFNKNSLVLRWGKLARILIFFYLLFLNYFFLFTRFNLRHCHFLYFPTWSMVLLELCDKGCLVPEIPHTCKDLSWDPSWGLFTTDPQPQNKHLGCFLFLKGKQKALVNRGKAEPCLDHHPRGILSTQFPLEIPETQNSSADSGHPFWWHLGSQPFSSTPLLPIPARKGRLS